MIITAKVIEDSIVVGGKRLTTVQLEYPRVIHAELMTHRVFSRSAASSRAIPVRRLIERVENHPYVPEDWGQNKAGMQSEVPLDPDAAALAHTIWMNAFRNAVESAKALAALGVHKQHSNRVLEPFAHIAVVVSSTEWQNFFNLRRSPKAQPEFQRLADVIYEVREKSIPVQRRVGDWHLPYLLDEERETLNPATAADVSAARCARVSYWKHDGTVPSLEDDFRLAAGLREDRHLSPFEHQAYALPGARMGNFHDWVQTRKLFPLESGETA